MISQNSITLEDLTYEKHNWLWYDKIEEKLGNINAPIGRGRGYFNIRKEYLGYAIKPQYDYRSACFSGDMPVGAISYRYETYDGDPPYLEITHLGSLISGFGIGTGLINHVKNIASREGFPRVGVTSLSDAVTFYRKCGFKRDIEMNYTGTYQFFIDV